MARLVWVSRGRLAFSSLAGSLVTTRRPGYQICVLHCRKNKNNLTEVYKKKLRCPVLVNVSKVLFELVFYLGLKIVLECFTT